MEMLNNFKDLLNSKTPFNQPSEKKRDPPRLNYAAGADILAHFQGQWEQLHQLNEDNANGANKLAELIAEVHENMSTKNSHMSRIVMLLATSGHIQENIDSSVRQVEELHETFENVEKALIDLEDLTEAYELEQTKRDHRFQLNLYKEKKMNSLDSLRAEQAMKHARNLVELEVKQKRALQERERVFQEEFKNDMETYMSLGTIPKIEIKQQPSALLEEITLDVDNDELNKFLEER